MRRPTPWFIAIALATSGCMGADYNSAAAEDAGRGTNLADASEGLAFRIDVLASHSQRGGLLDESFLFEAGEGDDLNLELSTPVTLSGEVSGFLVNPTADVSLPGQSSPISGRVRASVEGSVLNYAIRVEEDGHYELPLLPADGYTLSWVPDDTFLLPFEVDEGVTIEESTVRDVHLSHSESLSLIGVVVDADDLGVEGVTVGVVDRLSGAKGQTRATNERGVFDFRLYPGDYELTITHQSDDEPVPTIVRNVELIEGTEGATWEEVVYSAAESVKADGKVIGESGLPLSGVNVRFTSRSLLGGVEGEIVTESTTGSNGRYSIPLLRGEYDVEVIPNLEEGQSPVSIQGVAITDRVTELPIVTLSQRPVVTGQVFDAEGYPAAGVLLRAQEMEFNHEVFQGITDEDGLFNISVSEGEHFWTVVPASAEQGAITFGEGSSTSWQEREIHLKEGQPVRGCVTHEGEGIPLTPLELRDSDGTLFGSSYTDETGCFDLRIDIKTQAGFDEDME